ncbi:methyl-accepting chemotaxis protein [Hyalangium gracile]|uniref:methyl-accepting chemotaxis protein n=1 Tax=Hyalangium gracile TaxID=394092 RepID=UPI001CCE6858|nr:methyl-accepting chemotaxis protein [Hyalangium gracile]
MLARLRVGNRLMFLAGTLVALLTALGVQGLWNLELTQQGFATVYKDRVVPLRDLKVISDMYGLGIAEAAHKVRSGHMSWVQGRMQVEEARRVIDQRWRSYLGTRMVSEETLLIERLRPMMRAADTAVGRLLDILAREDATQLTSFIHQELYPAIDPVTSLLSELEELQLRVTGQEYAEAVVRYERTGAEAILLIAAGALLGAALSFFIGRSITRPLDDAVGLAERIAAGDLTGRLPSTSPDETGRLLRAMNEMSARLSTMIGEVLEGARSLSVVSQQVSSTAQTMAQGTQEQAAATEETSSTIELLNASILTNAAQSQQVARLAATSAREAEEGGATVQATVEAMRTITSRIAIIEEIAYRTHLLSLNAAIESSRAGEQGRGFSVVASEVRRLAESSRQAAREIRGVAASSIQLAERSGKVLQALVPAILRTTELVQGVATASQEQREGMAQIHGAILQVNEVTQRSASTAEELASTAEELASQAESFTQSMSVFHVSTSGEGRPGGPRWQDGASLPRRTQPGVVRPRGKHPAPHLGR